MSMIRTEPTRNYGWWIMKRILIALFFIGAVILSSAGLAGAAKNPFSSKSFVAMAKAQVACNKAIASNKVVTAKTVKVCNTANIPSVTACAHGPSVNQASVGSGDDVALLRIGFKPLFYVAGTTENPNPTSIFDVADISQLCGDPIDPILTPPAPPLTQTQVKALFKKCERAKTCPMKFTSGQ